MAFNWFSPFKVSDQLCTKLGLLGGTSVPAEDVHSSSGLVLLYAPPHLLLQEHERILEGYEALLSLSTSGHLLNLERCTEDELAFAAGLGNPGVGKATLSVFTPIVDPLPGLITLLMISQKPSVAERFFELELKSVILDREPESDYIDRLQKSADFSLVLQSYSGLIANLSRLEDFNKNLCSSNQMLSESLKQTEAMASSTTESSLRVEKDLEITFLRNEAQQMIIDRQNNEMHRALQLLARQADFNRRNTLEPSLAEPQMKRQTSEPRSGPVQRDALISAYQASLKRAYELLSKKNQYRN